MNKIKIASLFFSIIPFVSASAQRIEARQNVIDCGQVVFRHPVTVEFELKAVGGNVQITNARTSCGCTKVNYPKSTISNGEAFRVSATYDAKQMGHFEKQIGIYPKGSKQPTMLTIRGIVVDEIKDFAGEYPFTIASLNTDKTDIEFDDVNRGERPFQKIHVRNASSKSLEPVVMHMPNWLSSRVSPSTIAPGHSGEIIIMLDSRKLRDYGLNQTNVYLGMYPGDKVSPEKELNVSAVLLPDFNNMSEQELAQAPRIQLSTTTLDLGTTSGKKKLKGEILLQNVGKKQLEISKLQMFTTGVKVLLNKTKLEAGEMTKLKVEAEADKLKNARTAPRVLMITNDPDNPKVIITIK